MFDDLIDLSEQIAKLDTGKPKQASLRRAVSTAYYALFHFLVDEACRAQIGTQHSQRGYRQALGRAFVHTVMKQASSSYAGGTLKDSVVKGLPRDAQGKYVVPKTIRDLATLFVELQEKRHLADYDRSEQFKRYEVLALIGQTRTFVAKFRESPASNDTRFFLSCLWAWKELTNR